MADALAAAVERLRARAEEPVPDGIGQSSTAGGRGRAATFAPEGADAPARVERRRATRAVAPPVAPEIPPPSSVLELPQYKHSVSWIGRWRIRRKQRRAR
jgi:hypothetical protein